MNEIHFEQYRSHWESKKQNDQKLGTGVDKALSCLGDLLGPMSTLGDIGSYKCHFEMNLETAENDWIKHLPYIWMTELYNWITKPCLRLSYILCLLAITKCSSYLLLAMWQLIVTGDLLLWGGVLSSLLRGPRVLHWSGVLLSWRSLDNSLEKFLISFPEQTNPWQRETHHTRKSLIKGNPLYKGNPSQI